MFCTVPSQASFTTMTPPTIRAAGPADVPALSRLAKRTWADAFGHSVSPEDAAAELEETRSEAHFLAALREQTILVAEADGMLVGYAAFGPVDIRGRRPTGRPRASPPLRRRRVAAARRRPPADRRRVRAPRAAQRPADLHHRL